MMIEEKVAWLERYRQSLQDEFMYCQELESIKARRKLDRTGELRAVREELRKNLSDGVAIRGEVMRVIAGVKDPRDRAILYRRFILGEGFEQIAAVMMLDERWVRRCYKQCLEKLEPEKNKNH